jgi:predicted GNAT family N-acyltransferase
VLSASLRQRQQTGTNKKMANLFQLTPPQLLEDKSRLQEIYDLRVKAYENSPKFIYVNKEVFPNGWYDKLDERNETLHWIIEVDNKIIASARLAILDNIKDTNEDFDKFEMPIERPFAYWSRLVVHPDYRQTTAVQMLDTIRKSYLVNNSHIKFAVCCATKDRNKAILELGFIYLGEFFYNWGGGTIQQPQLIYVYLLQATH